MHSDLDEAIREDKVKSESFEKQRQELNEKVAIAEKRTNAIAKRVSKQENAFLKLKLLFD
jgi:hypothetical protein